MSYGYDSIYRLTSETIASDPNNVNGAASYQYDAVGNRTQKTSTIPGYPGGLTNYNANDQISTDTYDNDGNTTVSNGVGYVYDSRITWCRRVRESRWCTTATATA